MLAVLKKEHAGLNEQAIALNEEGIIIATQCKKLHDACPDNAVGTPHQADYEKLLVSINNYDMRVAAYETRTKNVALIAEKFEKSAKENKLEYIAALKITTDVARWNANTKKLLANIASERDLAEKKLLRK